MKPKMLPLLSEPNVQRAISAIFTHIEPIVYTNFARVTFQFLGGVLSRLAFEVTWSGTYAITSVFSLEMLISIMQIY